MAARLKLFGTPIEVKPSFFVVAVLLSMPSGLDVDELLRVGVWVLVVTLSILWHELGHALAMRAFGHQARIELYALGGLTRWEDGAQPGPMQRAVVSLAGPLAGLLVGGLVLVSARWLPPASGTAWGTLSSYLLWVNVAWGAVNLVPLLPLDGGNVMAAALDAATRGRGRLASQVVSIVVAVGLCVAAVALRWPWVALLAAWAGTSTFGRLMETRAEGRDEPRWEMLKTAWALMASPGTFDDGVEVTEEVLRDAQSARLRAVANEQLAWAWLIAGDAERAEAQLGTVPGTQPSHLLRGAILLRRGDAAAALGYLERAYAADPEPAAEHYLAEARAQLAETRL